MLNKFLGTVSLVALIAVSHSNLDVSSSLIVSPDGKTLKLTLTERDFFKVFYENYGEVCSFETIAGHLGIDPNEAYRHRIEVILSRLRRKFTKSLFYELPIKSIRGVGYVLAFENRDKKIDLSDQHAFISAQAQWAKSSARVA